ncbi:B-cell antigen receptor complex-associated protein beta chain isoform X1 [Panthera onca]|uniref:B-cell antigen receptor complex-associated protein beta chain isoform X1 n=1 Tax=Panthera tigris TaxID=9694 RepID=UPI00042BB8E8|nr:B-cell antigen receptor complex-associated protein beta chain isoform X1 [Panthera tigris]XP_049492320.1 B-cell antigen receptor complex-associated protein beta chain isoform X1 [Panthera uncia]
MAELVLSPMPSNWLVVLLLLLSAGVPAAKTEDLYQDPKGSTCARVWQNPRFIARKRGAMVEIRCYTKDLGAVSWLRKRETDLEPKPLLEDARILRSQNGTFATLTIQGIQFQDNGIYFCQQNCLKASPGTGCGTELRVMGFSTIAQLKRRNTLKDGIIMIQTLLIILFIIVPIFLLLDKDDSKPGMDEDHTYEGLNIDQTATYEDIVTLRTGEVKWSVGEHPGQE